MLGSLLESILLQAGLGSYQSAVDLLKICAVTIDLISEALILLLKLFVFVSLLRIQVVKLALIRHVDLLYLSLNIRDLIFHVSLLCEDLIQMRSLLIVLVLNVHVECFNVLWLCVTAVLIKSQIVISELSLIAADILDQGLILALEGHVSGIVLIDFFYLRLHLVDFIHNLCVLLLQQIQEVASVIDLATWPSCLTLQAYN